jgi:para-nitrobenzyl esterase
MNAIKEIEKDNSISPEAKQKVISEVLNGCWFSGEPDDKYYGKQKLVVR